MNFLVKLRFKQKIVYINFLLQIVPLSMRSGILEWVENSMQIGEYLVGDKGGAHALYSHSSHYSSGLCRRKLKVFAGVER